MDRLLSEKAVLDAIEDEWHGCTGEYSASTIINDTCQRIEQLPSAEPLTDVEQSIDDKVADLPSEAYYNKDWKSDMISRQEAMLKVARVDKDRYDNILDFHDACVDSLKELPPAEPQIIRCKECKHRDPEDKKCDCGHDIRWQLPRRDDWYCADAERRTDVKTDKGASR